VDDLRVQQRATGMTIRKKKKDVEEKVTHSGLGDRFRLCISMVCVRVSEDPDVRRSMISYLDAGLLSG
jgi:hypothetical protein